MNLDAFRSRLGESQGRVVPTGASPASGAHVFVLGDDQPGRLYNLQPGDHAEIAQQVDLGGVDLVRVHLELRVPAGLPAGLAWAVSIFINNVSAASATCRAGRARRITDLAANVSKLVGVHTVAIRLELVSL